MIMLQAEGAEAGGAAGQARMLLLLLDCTSFSMRGLVLT